MSALLHRMVGEVAQRRPESAAIRCDNETLTYGELSARLNGLARVLVDEGTRPRDRVALLLRKSADVPVGLYGVLAAGAVLVPIDPRSPAEQITRVLRATGATHLVSQPAMRSVLAEALTPCSDLTHLIGLEGGDDLDVECVPWARVAEARCDRPPAVATSELDPAYILHTSGSTGTPKLIQHTHRSAMSFVDWAVAEYSIRSDDILSNHSSHHTCFATFDFYAAARAGAATVILTPAAMMMPASLAALLERERLSVWYSVPTALVHLSLRGNLEARDLSSIRWVLFAGETFPNKHLRRIMGQLPEARFSHVYGSTEVNVCTHYRVPRTPAANAGALPIGKACPTSGTLVVDRELEPVSVGEVGELLVRGSTLMSGYWNDPDANRLALVRRRADDGGEQIYFRTGDQVRELADGNLVFAGRTDFQIKVRGHRVELEAVETALLSIPEIEEAAVYAVEDGEASFELKAAVVTAAGPDSQTERILSELRRLLPPYSVPSRIDLVSSLPRTATGKIDRKALETRERSREAVS